MKEKSMGFTKAEQGDVCERCGGPAELAMRTQALYLSWCGRCWKNGTWRDKDGIDRSVRIWDKVMTKRPSTKGSGV